MSINAKFLVLLAQAWTNEKRLVSSQNRDYKPQFYSCVQRPNERHLMFKSFLFSIFLMALSLVLPLVLFSSSPSTVLLLVVDPLVVTNIKINLLFPFASNAHNTGHE